MPKLRDLTGNRYGRLVVTGLSHRGAAYAYFWKCVCDCGERCIVRGASLANLRTKSCGCWKREARHTNHRKHGMSGTPTYKAWHKMLARCKPGSSHEKWYGNRGIHVCSRWHKFSNFLSDMGEKPVGLTLDRINNNMGYNPQNCRWATIKEQANNKRTTILLTMGGITKNLSEWAKEIGISREGIKQRLSKGVAIEIALSSNKFKRNALSAYRKAA